jgi:acetyl esterase
VAGLEARRALDPDLEELLDEINARAVPVVGEPDPEQLRADFWRLLDFLALEQPAFPGRVSDAVVASPVGDVGVRWHVPHAPADPGAVVVLFHGGGWVLGDLDSAAPFAAAIAGQAGLPVASVHYRRAPESPFPAAFDDCLAVVEHLAATPGRTWLAVAGDSAGGNLAAAVARRCALTGVRVDAQLLLYPALDPSRARASYQRFGDGFLLTSEAMEYYWRSYAGVADLSDPRLAPDTGPVLLALAPAVVATAGFDPLHDEGAAYAERLRDAGVPTTYLSEPTLIHGWLELSDRVPAARSARTRAIAALDCLRRAGGGSR